MNVIENKKHLKKLSELFNINYGMRSLHTKRDLVEGETLVISLKGTDNGTFGFFDLSPEYKNYSFITVPSTGSIGCVFVQEYECCVDDNCLVLIPKIELDFNICELFFVASILIKESWRFKYGRQVTPDRIDNFIIDFNYCDYDKLNTMFKKCIELYKNLLME
ncbi:MAG: restriction endonuclease subunit S [Parcubacteria group bacterium]